MIFAHVCILCELLGYHFRSPGMWDEFDLNCILAQGDELFTFLGNIRYLGMEDLPQTFLAERTSINGKFLENKTVKITAGTYLKSLR